MKPTIKFYANKDLHGNPIIMPDDLCLRARTLSKLLNNRPILTKDLHYIGGLGFDITGISNEARKGDLIVPDINFTASFVPDNSAIPVTLKPNCDHSIALHGVMGKYLLPQQLPDLYLMGYRKIIIEGDTRRFAKTLIPLDIKYEFLKDGKLIIKNFQSE